MSDIVKTKDLIIIVLLVLMSVLFYSVGYRNGERAESLKPKERFLISMHDALFHAAENGDLRKVQTSLGMVLLGEVRTYELEHGKVVSTNSFEKRFADAKLIADKVESNLVWIKP